MAKKAYSGSGTLYLAVCDSSGVKSGGYMAVGNAYPLSVQVEAEVIKVRSRQVGTEGQVIASKSEITDYTGSLTLHEWDAKNLAWALAGQYVERTEVGGTVASENVTALAGGEYAELAHRDVSVVVVQDVTDTITYVLDTDYSLNAKLGIIAPIAGGAIAEDVVLHVAYTYEGQAGYQVQIGTQAQIRVAMLAQLYNEYSGEHFELELDMVVLSSNTEINFISEQGSEGETLQFTLTPETVSGKTNPGRINGVTL